MVERRSWRLLQRAGAGPKGALALEGGEGARQSVGKRKSAARGASSNKPRKKESTLPLGLLLLRSCLFVGVSLGQCGGWEA